MSRVLPILFNTDMVRAILDERKTVTRRAVRFKYSNTEMKMFTNKYGTRLIEIQKDIEGETHGKYPDGRTWHKILPYIEKNPPYKKRDILYVRETWCNLNTLSCPCYYYKASDNLPEWALGGWKPSIHMPKEATRIWLKVTDVRVERLQDMTLDDFLSEGVVIRPEAFNDPENANMQARSEFVGIWNSTIRKPDYDFYGWDANPWTWVTEFERCEKPEEN